MKKIALLFFLLSGVVMLSFGEAIAEESAHGEEKADLSYAFGMAVAEDLKQIDLELNYSTFMRGFREIMEDQDTRIPMDEAMEKVNAAIIAAVDARAEANSKLEAEFLAENGARPGVYTTASGLQYEVLVEGSGDQPAADDYVKVHYTGCLQDGTVFDSTYDRDGPEEFPLDGVIPGWAEGIQLMRVGGKSRLFIPSALAYGSRGAGNVISPNAVIIFEVELLEILEEADL